MELTQTSAKRVLIVEDDDLFRRSLTGFVTALGYGTVAVGSVKEALDACHRATVDLVLTDYQLVESNGIDLIMALRNRGVGVPAVIISGYLSEEVRQRATDIRVAAILKKPADLGRLVEVIPELLGEMA